MPVVLPSSVIGRNHLGHPGLKEGDTAWIGGSEQWFDAPERDGIETMRIIMKDGVIYKNTL